MSKCIQNLNVLVIADVDAVVPNLDDPDDPNSVEDPSSPGPPGSWGRKVLVDFPDFPDLDPITGETYGSRAPPGTGGTGGDDGRRRVRRGGSARPPLKNVLVYAPSAAIFRCFQGEVRLQITKPAPDPLGFTGQTISFSGRICYPYNPPSLPGPTSAIAGFRTYLDILTSAGTTIPSGTLLLDAAAEYLGDVVGSDSFAVVTVDMVSIPSPGQCTGHACSASIPPSINGTGLGAVVNAA